MAGLVQVASPSQTAKRVNADLQPTVNQITDEVPLSSLAAYLHTMWERARNAKVSSGIIERLLKCDRQRKGEYDPEKLAAIRNAGSSEIYMMLTDIKCRAAESWIKDIMASVGNNTFTIDPTDEPNVNDDLRQAIIDAVTEEALQANQMGLTQPHPLAFRERIDELTSEVQEKLRDMADKAAKNMTFKIKDQLEDGGFNDAMFHFYTDFCTYPAAFVKGPVVKYKKKLEWDKNWKPVVKVEATRTFYRVSPYDMFPSPDAMNEQDSYLFERVRFNVGDLADCKGLPGYDDQAINDAIDQYSKGGLRNWIYGDSEKAMLDAKGPTIWVSPSDKIEGLEYWGKVSGKMLIEKGILKVGSIKINEYDAYDVSCILIGRHVIRAVLNPDPMGRRPYMRACFEETPGAVWGLAIPEMMRDNQTMCNAAARALANNIGIASGPMVEVTVDRLAEGEQVTNVYPWKVFQTTSDKTGGGQPAVRFYQPNLYAESLMAVFQQFSRQADEATGIPNYVYGSGQTGGGGRTAAGLSMLMENASKGIKQAISNIDFAVGKLIEQMYNHNMLYDDDQTCKCDAQVVARGALGMLIREMLVEKRQAFLQATLNPIDSQIMGTKGRAYLLGKVAEPLMLDIDKFLPTEEQMEQQEEAQQKQQQLQQAAMQQQAAAAAGGGAPGGDNNDIAFQTMQMQQPGVRPARTMTPIGAPYGS